MTNSKYFPPQAQIAAGRNRKVEITMTKEKRDPVPDDVTAERLATAGIISSDLNATRSKPAGSSPALRIACPVCKAPPGAYCTKTELVRAGSVLAGSRQVQQTIAHKKRREAEERIR